MFILEVGVSIVLFTLLLKLTYRFFHLDIDSVDSEDTTLRNLYRSIMIKFMYSLGICVACVGLWILLSWSLLTIICSASVAMIILGNILDIKTSLMYIKEEEYEEGALNNVHSL